MREIRTCEICGKKYVATQHNAKYCGAECHTEGMRRRNRANDREKTRQKIAEHIRKKDNQQAIIDIAVEAKKAGMSYGQYVARMGL